MLAMRWASIDASAVDDHMGCIRWLFSLGLVDRIFNCFSVLLEKTWSIVCLDNDSLVFLDLGAVMTALFAEIFLQ